jgi:cytochrome c5
MRTLLLALAAAGALALPAWAQQQAPLPAGENHDLVAATCTACHPQSTFNQIRRGPDAWRLQVYDMILRGAQVGPGDIDKVVDYLATNFGPGVNLPDSKPASLPEGAGKDLVEKNCVLCHGLDRVAGARRSAAEWSRIVAQMSFFGAPLSEAERQTAATYLAASLGTK